VRFLVEGCGEEGCGGRGLGEADNSHQATRRDPGAARGVAAVESGIPKLQPNPLNDLALNKPIKERHSEGVLASPVFINKAAYR